MLIGILRAISKPEVCHFGVTFLLTSPILNYKRLPKPIPPQGTISSWKVSEPFDKDHFDIEGPNDDLSTNLRWSEIDCEYNGLVNLSRLNAKSNSNNTVWVKAVIDAEFDQRKKLHFGYSDFCTILLNNEINYEGQRVFRSRDPSFVGTIGYFDTVYLDLKKGKNKLWFLVSENFGGWGIMAKFDDLNGIAVEN